MLKRNFTSEHIEPLVTVSENCTNEIEADNTSSIPQPNMEETVDNELTIISSDNESDSVLLLESNEHTHRHVSQNHIKHVIKEKAVNYYHWFLLLFKNGWWKTTLILWYIW